MDRHHCATIPASFADFCAFLQRSGCLSSNYAASDYVRPLQRCWELLVSLGAKSLLLQDRVRDPDFFAEYQAYYLSQHRHVSAYCARIHGFKTELADDAVDPLSELIDKADPDEYVGFITVRPLHSAPVAATILQAPTTNVIPCVDNFPVHIAGRDFKVIGTPFLQQDSSVGACAQASIWMALRTQRRRAGNSAFNTAELTLAATRYLMEDRVFPGRRGLTIEQMLQAIRFAGHEPCVVPIDRDTKSPSANDSYTPASVPHARLSIEPYVESGLPVILCMSNPQRYGHAVIAIGKSVNGPPPQQPTGSAVHAAQGGHRFIIHNDSSGPYLELDARSPSNSADWAIDDVISIIVPMPDGVTVTASEADSAGWNWLERLTPSLAAGLQVQPNLREGLVIRHFLVERHVFRSHMREVDQGSSLLKQRCRAVDLPPWVWIYEVHLQAEFAARKPSRVCLFVFDATSDIDSAEMPLVAHLNGLLVSNLHANTGFSLFTRTVLPKARPEYFVSKDDALADPIPPQRHT